MWHFIVYTACSILLFTQHFTAYTLHFRNKCNKTYKDLHVAMKKLTTEEVDSGH
jgi:hypothetical protein